MNDITNPAPHDVMLVIGIVSAYVANNPVPAAELPALIGSTYAALAKLSAPATSPVEERPSPPIPIRRTVTPDHIISLEDGKPYKALRRHLTGRGLTPEQYREKWGLPFDYPMVAANYAAQRSELARIHGLGQIRSDRAASARANQDTTVSDKPARRRKAGLDE